MEVTNSAVKNGNIYTVSNQWAGRPDDERMLDLYEMRDKVKARTGVSRSEITDNKTLNIYAAEEGNALVISTPAGPHFMTNWTFGQLCQAVHAPAGYMRQLPAPLVEANLNHGLKEADREENMIYVNTETKELRAMTSPTYGRIFDLSIVNSIIRMNEESSNRWVIPAASYQHQNPRRATTLYCSDRDIFIFLCDPKNPVVVNGKELFRGFFTWNSEVGAKTWGFAQFLYNRVCDNRIIWGAENFQQMIIKHTSGAPERFAREGAPKLLEYANSSARQIEDKILRAQNIRLGKDKEEVTDFLRKMGFTQGLASSVIDTAKDEEGDFRSAWDIAQGITAKARTIQHTDARVDLERMAGKVLDKVVGK